MVMVIRGIKMTKEKANEEYLKLLKEKFDKENEIVEKAKKDGTWKMGLDGNRDLFKVLDDEYKKKIEALKNSVDKE